MFKINKDKIQNFQYYFNKKYKNVLWEKTIFFHLQNNTSVFYIKGLLEYQDENNSALNFELINRNEYLYLYHNENYFPITCGYYGEQVPYSELNKKISESIIIQDLLYKNYTYEIKNIITNKLTSNYTIFTKYTLLKELLKINWIDKVLLKKVISDYEKNLGFRYKTYRTRDGKLVKGLYPNKLMIKMSSQPSICCELDWKTAFPEEFKEKEMFIQGGTSGLVIAKNETYTTAFVEIFPSFLKDRKKIFSSFIRGEGIDIIEAESNAFKKLQKIKNCKNHEWDRRDRTDGAAFCKKCGVFNSSALTPTTKCHICKKPTNKNQNDNKYYCDKCYNSIPSNTIKTKDIVLFKQDMILFKTRFTRTAKKIIKDNNITNKKLIKNILKKEYLKSTVHNYYYTIIPLRYPNYKHLITKLLKKYNKENYNKNKIIVDLLMNYSILFNVKPDYKGLIQYIKDLD